MKMGQLARKLKWDKYLCVCLCTPMHVRICTDTELAKIFLNSDLFFNIYDTVVGEHFSTRGIHSMPYVAYSTTDLSCTTHSRKQMVLCK